MKQLFLFAVVCANGFAVGTQPLPSANLYQCTGVGNVSASFSTTSFAGTPNYHVVDGDNEIDLRDTASIEIQQTPMGSLVTGSYTKQAMVDGPIIRYSLIVPSNEIRIGEKLKVETLLLKTTAASLFRPEGVSLQTEETQAIPLECEASLVVF